VFAIIFMFHDRLIEVRLCQNFEEAVETAVKMAKQQKFSGEFESMRKLLTDHNCCFSVEQSSFHIKEVSV